MTNTTGRAPSILEAPCFDFDYPRWVREDILERAAKEQTDLNSRVKEGFSREVLEELQSELDQARQELEECKRRVRTANSIHIERMQRWKGFDEVDLPWPRVDEEDCKLARTVELEQSNLKIAQSNFNEKLNALISFRESTKDLI